MTEKKDDEIRLRFVDLLGIPLSLALIVCVGAIVMPNTLKADIITELPITITQYLGILLASTMILFGSYVFWEFLKSLGSLGLVIYKKVFKK